MNDNKTYVKNTAPPAAQSDVKQPAETGTFSQCVRLFILSLPK